MRPNPRCHPLTLSLSRIVLPQPLPCASLSLSLSPCLSLVFVLSIIDSRALGVPLLRRVFQGAAERKRRELDGRDISLVHTSSPSALPRPLGDPIPVLASSPLLPHLLVTLFFISPAGQTPLCALHLLITNDKSVLRLHRRDRTEANSRRRKCALGRDALSPHDLSPTRDRLPRCPLCPLGQNFKNKSACVSHTAAENFIC